MLKKTPAIQVFVKPFCISLNRFRVKVNLAVLRGEGENHASSESDGHKFIFVPGLALINAYLSFVLQGQIPYKNFSFHRYRYCQRSGTRLR